MRRFHIVPAVLMLAILAALRVQAQEHAHTVAMPETLKWVEPATLPGAWLAVVQGDPSKEGLFVYRLKMPAGYRIPPHLRSSTRARGRSCRSVDSRPSRRTIRTTRGWAARRRSCKFTVWDRPISGS